MYGDFASSAERKATIIIDNGRECLFFWGGAKWKSPLFSLLPQKNRDGPHLLVYVNFSSARKDVLVFAFCCRVESEGWKNANFLTLLEKKINYHYIEYLWRESVFQFFYSFSTP